MIAQRFKAVLGVSLAGVAGCGLYLISLQVAAERNRLEAVERKIALTRHDIMALQTEFGARASMRQLEKWNGEVLAMAAPKASQFLQGEVQLAAFDPGTGGFLPAKPKVMTASVPAPAQPPAVAAPAPKPAPAAPPSALEPKVRFATFTKPDAKQPVVKASTMVGQPLLRHAALTVTPSVPMKGKPAAATKATKSAEAHAAKPEAKPKVAKAEHQPKLAKAERKLMARDKLVKPSTLASLRAAAAKERD